MPAVRHHLRKRWLEGISVEIRPPVGDFILVAPLGAAVVFALAANLPDAGATQAIAAFLTYAVAAAIAGHLLRLHYPHERLGLCNVVTLGRLALAATLIAPMAAGTGASWAVFSVAAIALSLDGLDGLLARRQGLVSAFGARFDMEVDAAMALVLALNAAAGSAAGLVAVLLGLPRYLFAAAELALPWMRRDLPARFSRKAVCVLQLFALIALQAPILPATLALALVPLVAAALVWSFAIDVLWLWRRRP